MHAAHAGTASRAGHAPKSSAVRGRHASHAAVSASGGHIVRKRVLLTVLAVIAALLVSTAAYGAWYANQIQSAISLDSNTSKALSNTLTATTGNDPFYVLVLGSDSREGSGTSSNPDNSGSNQRSDVMILVRIDPSNKQVTMVSIPRDTRWTPQDGSVTRINEAMNIGGPALSVAAVEDLTGVKISHYVQVDFSDFENIVDAVGGIDVNVPIEVSYSDALTGQQITLEPGMQTLNGQQAQVFVRARHEYGDNQEAKRQSNVRTAAVAIFNKIKAQPAWEIPNTLLTVAKCLSTDMSATDLANLASKFTSGGITIYSGTGPTHGDYDEAANGMWLCYSNPDGWAKIMSVVDAGGDPSKVTVE